MKKLFALMLVFGMASMASAALQISVGGVQEPHDTDIWLMPSETIVLDIWTQNTIPVGGAPEEGTYALVCGPLGTISGGVNVSPEPSVYIYPYTGTGVAGIWTSLTVFNEIPGGSTIIDDIVFHCEDIGDVLIELIYDPVYPIYGVSAVVDSVIIHQIPEPATMALLSLGGLFLLRRRK
jgi:hypothetical protein